MDLYVCAVMNPDRSCRVRRCALKRHVGFSAVDPYVRAHRANLEGHPASLRCAHLLPRRTTARARGPNGNALKLRSTRMAESTRRTLACTCVTVSDTSRHWVRLGGADPEDGWAPARPGAKAGRGIVVRRNVSTLGRGRPEIRGQLASSLVARARGGRRAASGKVRTRTP